MKKSKEGISLITLIITIIVIIILAAIVIFTGLRTPDSAQFSSFAQQVDNVQMAVTNKFADLKTQHAIAKEYRTDEQIYIEIATATDPGQYASMGTTTVKNGSNSIATGSTGIQNIDAEKSTDKEHSIGMELPKVREYNTAWYVTKEGKVFNANGYAYDDKTYFDAKTYYGEDIGSNSTKNANRAEAIYGSAISKGIVLAVDVPVIGEDAGADPKAEYQVAAKLNVGDWVEYTPDGTPYELDGAISGTGTTQTIPPETSFSASGTTRTTKWRVWSNDGTTVKIVPEHGVNYFNVTGDSDNCITLKGAAGYINGPTVISDICKKLYTNSTLGITSADIESMTIEEIESKIQSMNKSYSTFTRDGVTYGLDDDVEYNSNNSSGIFLTTPLAPGQEPATGEKLEAKKVTIDSAHAGNTITLKNNAFSNSGTITWKKIADATAIDRIYNTPKTEETGISYGDLIQGPPGWLASPCVLAYSGGAYFGLFYVHSGSVSFRTEYTGLYVSASGEYPIGFGLLPLVSLSSSLHVDSEATNSDGTTYAKAWKLVK